MGVYIEAEGVVKHVQQLREIATRHMVENQSGRHEVAIHFTRAVTMAREKARNYRRLLKQLNRAHRLMKLEHKELIRKYEELASKGTNQEALELAFLQGRASALDLAGGLSE